MKQRFLGLKKQMPWEPDWVISGILEDGSLVQYPICSAHLVLGFVDYFTVGDEHCDFSFNGIEDEWGVIRFSESTDSLICEKSTQQVAGADTAPRFTAVEIEQGAKIAAGKVTLFFEPYDADKYQPKQEEAKA